MTNSFFSNPEDELTVEEIKSLGKLIPKLPNLSGALNPKNWDSKFAPGRGEGRAAFAQSKRNLDAMLERDALTAKNRGNTGTFINNPQTKKPFATPWRESDSERKSKLLAPNTNETATKSNPWSIQSLQDKGSIQTNLSKEQIAKAESQPTVFDEDTASKAAKIPKDSNIISRTREQAQGKGSVAKNKALLADMRAEQASSAVDTKGDPLPTKDVKVETIPSNLTNQKFYEGPTQNFWNKDIPLVDTKGIEGAPSFGVPKGIDLDKGAEIFNPANMAKDMKAGPSFAEGMKMNEGGGMSGAATLKIASMILGALNKKKGGDRYIPENKSHGSMDQVAVAAGIDPEQFYAMV